IKAQAEAVAAADDKVNLAREAWEYYGRAKRQEWKTGGAKEEEWDKLLGADPKNYELHLTHVARKRELEFEKVKLNALKAVDVTKAQTSEAEAGVDLYKAQVQEAENAVSFCTVKAKVAGTIEQINVGPGDTISAIGTQSPAMILIPGGPRV